MKTIDVAMDTKETVNSQYIPIADAVIHCKIAGSENDPALILLHGNSEDLQIFDQQTGYFSQYYRTIAIDTRGHGKSLRGTKPLNFHTFAADLIETLDALKIDKANIIGFSDGAIIALHTALAAPKRISAMVLLGANYNSKGILLKYRFSIWLIYLWLSVASPFSAKMRKRKEIWKLMINQPCLTIEEISQITIPTLVATGENDMVSQRQNDEICAAIKDSQRLIISGGNHFWLFKQPEIFNDYVMKFLKNNRLDE